MAGAVKTCAAVAVAAIVLASTAGAADARLELRQNVVGGVATTTTPANGAIAAVDTATAGLLATTTTPVAGAAAVAASTTPLPNTNTALSSTTPVGAVKTTPTAAALTSNTAAATTSMPTTSTTQTAVQNPGGAVGGGAGVPTASTASGEPNLITATMGSGGVLDYGSCIAFESQCNQQCSYGIYSMGCDNGGACVCYSSNPDSTNASSDGGNGDNASSGSSLSSSFWTMSSLSVLPAFAALAITAAFF
ncbi:hypothetical protein LPJ59_000838 [Coemansia sp. RSA 2399]|nr:hypothetical protein LPJ59_000838 [Coemansia sp. RSA 2399]